MAAVIPHHLLASDLIEEVFSQLQCHNDVPLIIISPDHYQQLKKAQLYLTNHDGKELFSIFPAKYQKMSEFNQAKVVNEHGYAGLLPIINKFCPKVSVYPIIINHRSQLAPIYRQLGRKLASLSPLYLIISSDFSHHGNLIETEKNDILSLHGLQSQQYEQIINDCLNCWEFLLGYFQGPPNFHFQNHRNSYHYGGESENITSYITGFFTK